jgi:hypothetical protein
MISLCYVDIFDMNNCGNDGHTSSVVQTQQIDRIEQKRQRERQRYAQMSADKKNELLARRHEAYQQRKSLAGKNTFNKTPWDFFYDKLHTNMDSYFLPLSCHFIRAN